MNVAALNSRIFLNDTPPPAPPASPEPVYQAVDELLVALETQMTQDPALAEQLKEASREVKNSFKEALVGTASIPETAEAAREAALNALAAGLIAGALDGAIMLHASAASSEAKPASATENPEGIGEEIGKAFDRFVEELKAKFEEAKEELKRVGVDALQRGSAEGKALGTQVVDESARFAGSDAHLVQWQGFQAAAFGLGYAIGGTDAAIVMLTDQTPGQQS